jgi:hypothetical protein
MQSKPYDVVLLPDDNLREKALQPTTISKNKTVKATALDYRHENEYLDIEYIKSDELVTLQEQIIETLNPIRDGLRERDKERVVDAVGETRSNLMKYGYRSVGNMFSPHLTFTRFKDNQKNILEALPAKESFDGTYPLIGIFEMGDNGTCIKKVGTWQLQNLANH